MNIRFRYISIIDENNNAISGFALCFDSLAESNKIFEILIKSYEESHVFEKTTVKFYSADDGTYSLKFLINGDDSFKAELSKIDKKYVQLLKEAIEEQGTIFIVSAKSKTEEEFQINKGKYICITRIYINDVLVERIFPGKQFSFELLKEFIS